MIRLSPTYVTPLFFTMFFFQSVKIPAMMRADDLHFSTLVSVLETYRLPEDVTSKSNTHESLQIPHKQCRGHSTKEH